MKEECTAYCARSLDSVNLTALRNALRRMDLVAEASVYLEDLTEDELQAELDAVPSLRVVRHKTSDADFRICYKLGRYEQSTYVRFWRTPDAVAAKVADTLAGFGNTKSSDPERVRAHLRAVKGVMECYLDSAGRGLASLVAGELVKWACGEFEGFWLWQTDKVSEAYWN